MVLYRFYKIYYPDEPDGLSYVGQTTLMLKDRWRKHKSDYKLDNKCSSKKVFEKYGIENCVIELLEEIDFEKIIDVRKKEREYIQIINNCVNMQKPTLIVSSNRSSYQQEYRNLIKDKIKLYKKIYLEQNKEQMYEKAKQKILCEVCNCEFRKGDLARHNKSKKHLSNLNNN